MRSLSIVRVERIEDNELYLHNYFFYTVIPSTLLKKKKLCGIWVGKAYAGMAHATVSPCLFLVAGLQETWRNEQSMPPNKSLAGKALLGGGRRKIK
jgi:hypothetical protein